MKTKVFLVLALFVLSASFLTAQQTPSGNTTQQETTIEQLYLQNFELQIVRQEALDASQESKLRALSQLGDMIRNNRVPRADLGTYYVLDYLSQEGVLRRSVQGSRVVNYYPEVRRQSCELMGLLGGEGSRNTLIVILGSDDEPMVLAEAAFALGQIGTDEDMRSSRAIATAIITRDVVSPNNNFAAAAINAFRLLADANDGIRDPVVFQSLISIAQGTYLREVRQSALNLLDYLRRNF